MGTFVFAGTLGCPVKAQEKAALDDGIYKVTAKMLKTDKASASMADGAFTHQVKVTVSGENVKVTMNFKGLNSAGSHGYLSNIAYFKSGYTTDKYGAPVGDTEAANVESVQKYTNGKVYSDEYGTNYPDIVSFPIISEALDDGMVPMQMEIPLMKAINPNLGVQKAYLDLDFTTAAKTTADDPDFAAEDVVEKAPEILTAPKAPAKVKAVSASYQSISVSWDKVSGANGYEVYQDGKKVATTTATKYTKAGLRTGTTYRYQIRAYKKDGSETAYSEKTKAVSAKPVLSPVTTVSVKNSAKKTAKLTWKKVSGASGYVVARATKKNGTYKNVKTLTKGSVQSYADKSLKKNATYYYKVRVYRTVAGKKVYAAYSKTISVRIKK